MEDIFRGFDGRDDDLRAVKRFSLFKVMFYRTNLYTHSHRVAFLTRSISRLAAQVFSGVYDPLKAELMALVHDDAEIIFGDVQAGNKSRMTEEQLAAVESAETAAIETISERFPNLIAGYSYRRLLVDYAKRTGPEAQVVCYADKYDALGEVLHEIYAGNSQFVTPVTNEYGLIPLPSDYYADYFASFADKFPAMKPLLSLESPIFKPVPHRDYSAAVAKGKPHELQSLLQPTGDHHYDNWKNLIIKYPSEEVSGSLYKQVEFLG